MDSVQVVHKKQLFFCRIWDVESDLVNLARVGAAKDERGKREVKSTDLANTGSTGVGECTGQTVIAQARKKETCGVRLKQHERVQMKDHHGHTDKLPQRHQRHHTPEEHCEPVAHRNTKSTVHDTTVTPPSASPLAGEFGLGSVRRDWMEVRMAEMS